MSKSCICKQTRIIKKDNKIKFKDLEVGNFFLYNGNMYFKINTLNVSSEGDINSIQFCPYKEVLIKSDTIVEFGTVTFKTEIEVEDIEE